jgi:hypothetical protein
VEPIISLELLKTLLLIVGCLVLPKSMDVMVMLKYFGTLLKIIISVGLCFVGGLPNNKNDTLIL